MSLAINEEAVTAVLLADGWHEIKPASFMIDSYEFVETDRDDARLTLGGGGEDLISARGFTCVRDVEESRMSGPLHAVLAVLHQ